MAYTKQTVTDGGTISSAWGNSIQTQYDEVKAELAKTSSGDILIANENVDGLAMVKIAEITLGTDGQITFSNIPQTYKDLKLVIKAISAYTSLDRVFMRANGDTTQTNYAYGFSYQNSTSNTTGQSTAWETGAELGWAPPNANTASHTRIELDIIDYAHATHFPTWLSRFGMVWSTQAGNIKGGFHHGQRGVTGAITAINLYCMSAVGGNLKAGSSAILYGLK